jgi:histidinol-phosphate aminotransferase
MASLADLKPRGGLDNLTVYETGKPLEEVAREQGLEPDGLVKLASNENNLGPSPLAIEAMRLEVERMHLYPDGGAFYLREALASHLEVEGDMLLFGNGSNELIEFLGHLFLQPGTNLVMSQCAFIVYKLVGDLFGAETRMAPMRDFTHDLDAMTGLVDENTRLVFVANPNNPTGTRVDNEKLKAFLENLPGHVLPVIDEAYIELMEPQETPDTLGWLRDMRPMVILRTFSKAYGLAGLRIGYAVSQPEVIRWLGKFRQPFNVNAMAQAAARAAVEDQSHVAQTRVLAHEGLAYFAQAFAELGLETVPSSANFLLVKTGEGRRRFQELQSRGVIARAMDGYGLPDWLRITVGTEGENLMAVQALKGVLGL